MTNDTDRRLAWIAASASALNKHGSWTGRIHIHKLIYVVKELGCDSVPFSFRLYDYGPYSFDLDEEIINAQLRGVLVQSYPQPGYGPRYLPSPSCFFLCDDLQQSEIQLIGKVAREFGGKGSKDLERIATCIWIIKREDLPTDDRIIQRAVDIKPKYQPEEFQPSLHEAKRLLAALSN